VCSWKKAGDQGAKSSFCGCRDDSVAKESQFVGAIVTGDAQLGIVQPTGSPINVSTQRGFSLAEQVSFFPFRVAPT
jgi:hypothetical protein